MALRLDRLQKDIFRLDGGQFCELGRMLPCEEELMGIFCIDITLLYGKLWGVFYIPSSYYETFGTKFGPRVYAFVMFSNASSAIVNLMLGTINESGMIPI